MNQTVLCVLMLRISWLQMNTAVMAARSMMQIFHDYSEKRAGSPASKGNGSVSQLPPLYFFYLFFLNFPRLRWTSRLISLDDSSKKQKVGIRGEERLLCLACGAVETQIRLCHSEFSSDIPRLIQFFSLNTGGRFPVLFLFFSFPKRFQHYVMYNDWRLCVVAVF